VGDIAAAICTAIVLKFGFSWLWALFIPAVANLAWGFVCLTLAPDPEEMGIVTEEARARDEKAKLNPPRGGGAEPAADEKTTIAFRDAVMIPNVMSYAVAFGFFKLTNYVLFFWLPFFLSAHFDPVTANLIASL
jgi:sugar phosphate permease